MKDTVRKRLEIILGASIKSARTVSGGYSAAQRWIVHTALEQRYFVKVGVPPVANVNLLEEAAVYAGLKLACMPEVLAFDDHAENPILVLEDLSHGDWPPPWKSTTINEALSLIEDIHAVSVDLPSFYARHGYPEGGWWGRVHASPSSFLQLGLVDRAWMQAHIDTLVEAELSVPIDGEKLTHFDLRSDNICFTSDGPRLIDWSHACLGNPKLDLGLFLPSLSADGGPGPEEVVGSEPGVAAWVAGFFAYHASKPFIPSAPFVRTMQLKLLKESLPWARRELRV